jgi:hypothetical protein
MIDYPSAMSGSRNGGHPSGAQPDLHRRIPACGKDLLGLGQRRWIVGALNDHHINDPAPN